MKITGSMVKELRERTGAGMMSCKTALTDSSGDMDRAIEALRKQNIITAEKKASRIAAEGTIVLAANEDAAALVEINCETDFVGKDASFKTFSQAIADRVLEDRPKDVKSLLSLNIKNGSVQVEQALQELTTKVGEKLSIRRFAIVPSTDGHLSTYLHGNRIGVAVRISGGNQTLGHDLALHIAASRPLCVSAAEMEPSILQKEKDIITAQARESDDPESVIEEKIDAQIKAFIAENTLLGQPFVKNPSQSVGHLLATHTAKVDTMCRFEVGEGLEKRDGDFVAEVMAQASS